MLGRHELKFIVNKNVGAELFQRLERYCEHDNFADERDNYEIASLYYDTPALRFYRDRNESVGYRRKLRLRCYSRTPTSYDLFLEIKEKHKSLVHKKRQALELAIEQLPDFRLEQLLPFVPDGEMLREVVYLHSTLTLVPVVIVRYLRTSLVAKDYPNLRITLDHRLTAGNSDLAVYFPTEERLILDPQLAVLEIKSDRSIPKWLQTELVATAAQRVRYSKYCEAVDAIAIKNRDSAALELC